MEFFWSFNKFLSTRRGRKQFLQQEVEQVEYPSLDLPLIYMNTNQFSLQFVYRCYTNQLHKQWQIQTLQTSYIIKVVPEVKKGGKGEIRVTYAPPLYLPLTSKLQNPGK